MMREERMDGQALIALGSNLPWRDLKPSAILQSALKKLGELGEVQARSGWWRTEAWPDPKDPPFLNLVARLRTDLEPVDLMIRLLEIETSFGRERSKPNAPRTLDLDLIDYDGRTFDAPAEGDRPALALPHPRMHERAFVLLPLQDVAPAWRHPRLGVSVYDLIARLLPEQRAGVRRVEPGESL
jgi:2-amino-4-hydroxy-6-hydroxymethyldihydropteridine diphosphokinase